MQRGAPLHQSQIGTKHRAELATNAATADRQYDRLGPALWRLGRSFSRPRQQTHLIERTGQKPFSCTSSAIFACSVFPPITGSGAAYAEHLVAPSSSWALA